MPAEVIELIADSFEFLLRVGLGIGKGEHLLVVGIDEIDQLRLVRALFGLALVLQFKVFVSQFLQLALFSIDFCL